MSNMANYTREEAVKADTERQEVAEAYLSVCTGESFDITLNRLLKVDIQRTIRAGDMNAFLTVIGAVEGIRALLRSIYIQSVASEFAPEPRDPESGGPIVTPSERPRP